MSGPLGPEEIAAFLHGPVIARLATVQPGGAPYIAPVWQQWDGSAMYIVGRAASRFVQHVRDNDHVAVSCADDVNPDHRRLLIEGRAEVVEGPAPMSGLTLRIAEEMAVRYMGPSGPLYVRRTMDRPRCLITVTPDRITSWAGGDWHPRYT